MPGRLPYWSRRNKRAAVAAAIAAMVCAGATFARAQSAGASPPAARAVVAAAVKKAAAEKKVVLVEFGASWCTWCRSFDAFVHAPGTAKILADNFVVTNLTVQERGDKKPLENPGGEELMTEWDGLDAGLPFYVFLNATGGKIADSNVMKDGSNVGFPGTPEEVDAFMGLMQATAPRLTPANGAALRTYLTKAIKP